MILSDIQKYLKPKPNDNDKHFDMLKESFDSKPIINNPKTMIIKNNNISKNAANFNQVGNKNSNDKQVNNINKIDNPMNNMNKTNIREIIIIILIILIIDMII